MVTLTGVDSGTLTEAALVESTGSKETKGVLETQGRGKYLVRVEQIPSVEFVVRVKGQDGSATARVFQRQSPTNFQASNVTITVSSTHPSPSHQRTCCNKNVCSLHNKRVKVHRDQHCCLIHSVFRPIQTPS